MCMLSFIPANVEAEAEDLLNGGILNADGSGYAIATKEHGILMGKSMKVEEALDEFLAKRAKHKDCPAMFHSRWATHGTTGVGNVHPFLVGGSHQTVVGHNGVLPCTPDKDDWRSDTRILADEYLPGRYRRLDKPGVVKALSTYIGKSNKLVILTTDPRYKKNAYIINEDRGNWDTVTGVWHSNYDYLGTKYYGGSLAGHVTGKGKKSTNVYTTTTGKGFTYENGVWTPSKSDNCTFCGYGVIGKAGYCMDCGTCNDCGDFRQDCQCWAGYYSNFDWDAATISRKALESSSDDDIPTLGTPKADEAQTDYARAGMSLTEIMDNMEEGSD